MVAAFFPASLSGQLLEVKDEIGASPRLIDNLPGLQQIFGCWKSELQPFSVAVACEVSSVRHNRVCSFFSGGVDGLYTLIMNEDEITDLIYINGFDFQMEPEEFSANIERAR